MTIVSGGDGGAEGLISAILPLCIVFVVLAIAEARWPLVRAPVEARGRLATNFGLGLLNLAIATALPLTAPAAALVAARQGWGLFNIVAAPGWAVVAVTLLAMSLLQYAFHRAAHRWAWLWRLHRVHHADTAVDLSTTLRNHPAELAVLVLAQIALAVLLGLSAAALLFYQVLAICFGLWTHANLTLPERIDKRLRQVVVTPVMHHRHHSAERIEADSNFGDILAVWDRLFGTYDPAAPATLAAMRRGLGDTADGAAAQLWQQLSDAFRR